MRFLIRLILIVLAAVAIAVVGLLMLPGDRIAQIAASQIAKQTGREVEISSDSSISLYPTLGITTGRAVIGSTEWAQEGPLFVADSVAIGIDVPALLGGTIRIQKLEATAPRIVLERGEDGKANWEFFPADGTETQASTETAATEEASQSYDFSLEQAIIRNASLTYVDRVSGTSQKFENVDLQVSWPDAASAAEISLGISPFGERININATVSNVLEIATGAVTPLQGMVSTGDAQIEFAGTASIAPQAAMQITLAAPDASQLLRAAGQSPAALGLPEDFAPNVEFSGNVTYDGERAAIRGMNAVVDDSTLSGDVDVTLGEAFGVTTKAAVDLKAVGDLMRMAGQQPETFGLAADFNPAIKSDITLQMTGADIAATLRNLQASIAGATIAGSADVAMTSGAPNIAAKLKANVPDIAQVARQVGQPLTNFGLSENAAPSFSGDIDATIQGETIRADISNLIAELAGAKANGTVTVAVDGGTPNIAARLNTNVPNVAQLAQQVGQPLTSFGLSANAAPSFSGNVNATVQGSNIRADISNMVAGLAGATASGAVNVAVAGNAPSVSGSIKANVPSTANLMSALGQSAADIPRGFGRAIAANTALNYSGNTLTLSDMSVSLDQNTLSGRAAIGLGGSRPNISAQLSAGALDFSSLSEGGGESSGATSSGWSKDRIDASALGLANANINLSASSINLGSIQLGNTSVNVSVDNSRAVVTLNDVRAYQGAFSGQVVANNRSGLSVAAKLNAKSVALQPLLTALAGIDRIAGNASMNVDVLGVGNSVHAIMNTLRGSIAMSVPKGTIAGVDFDGLMRTGNANASLTQFSGLQASGAISDGVLSNNDLSVVTGRVDVTGDGLIKLGSQSIDYVVTPVAKDVGDKERVSIPVRIKGPWSNVSITPDLERALQMEAEREAEKLKKKAQEEVEREKEKLREKAQAEAKKLEERAKKKAEDAARRAAEKAAKKLKLDKKAQQKLEDAAKNALESEVKKGLKNLLGGN